MISLDQKRLHRLCHNSFRAGALFPSLGVGFALHAARGHVVVSVIFFSKGLLAIIALERLLVLVDLLDVLLDISLLGESLVAAGVRALEWSVLCVRPHVVHEF